MSSSDPQALDMITASDCVNVGLRRTVGYTSAPGIEKKRVAYQESSREFGKAVWWPSASVQGDRHNRHLEGEIRLAKDLRPTSLMDHFSISVRSKRFTFFGLLTPFIVFCCVAIIQHLRTQIRSLGDFTVWTGQYCRRVCQGPSAYCVCTSSLRSLFTRKRPRLLMYCASIAKHAFMSRPGSQSYTPYSWRITSFFL